MFTFESRHTKRDRILVAGYLREAENEYKLLSVISKDIVEIVFEYKRICDSWNREYTSSKIEINDEGNQIKVIGRSLHTAFGTHIVERGVFEWNIKCDSVKIGSNNSPPFFGLIHDDMAIIKNNKDDAFWCSHKKGGYIWCGGDTKRYGDTQKYRQIFGNQCNKSGDILTITLDLDNRLIGISLNGKFLGNAWTNIRKKKYRLHMCFQGNQGSIFTLL